jgi:hypothetical protein
MDVRTYGKISEKSAFFSCQTFSTMPPLTFMNVWKEAARLKTQERTETARSGCVSAAHETLSAIVYGIALH